MSVSNLELVALNGVSAQGAQIVKKRLIINKINTSAQVRALKVGLVPKREPGINEEHLFMIYNL